MSQQILGRKIARRMLTYEKTSDATGLVSGGPRDDWSVRHAIFEDKAKGSVGSIETLAEVGETAPPASISEG